MNKTLIAVLVLVLALVLALAALQLCRGCSPRKKALRGEKGGGAEGADTEREELVVVVLSADGDDEGAPEKKIGQECVDALMEASYFRGVLVQQKELLPDAPAAAFPRWYLRHPFARIVVVAVGPAAGEVACEMRRQGGDRVAGVVLVGPGPLAPLVPPEIAARFEGAEAQVARLAADHLAANVAALKSLAPGGVKIFTAAGPGGSDAYVKEFGAPAVVTAKWSAAVAKMVSRSINSMMRRAMRK